MTREAGMDPETTHTPDDDRPLLAGWPRRGLLKGAGLAGAAGVAGALLRSPDASAQSSNLFGLQIVSPSGVMSGTTDTTNIQTALNDYGLVALTPGTYYVTQLTIPSGGRLIGCGWGPSTASTGSPATGTVVRAGNGTPVPTDGETVTYSTYPMITVPVGNTHWVIQDIVISGQAPPVSSGSAAYFPYTALIYVTDAPISGGVTNDDGTIYRCYVESSGGDGIYIGTERSWIMVDECWSTDHNQNSSSSLWGSQILGAAISINTECIISRCAFARSYYGYYIGTTAAMTRVIDSDIFGNQVGGNISSGTASVERCSHDQQQQTGITVRNSATGVTIHSRFTSNGLSKTGTYYGLDVSGAGKTGNGQPGVIVAPGTIFVADEFGDTQQVEYDIYTGGDTGLVQDYSTWDKSQYSVSHID
jgi:hypothetical protein